ncbi:hypothetical protein QYE76_002004 [Lolium multiflorum]|uniref:Uncharacterized protein n=1 Tax=Lolium multiflorum TaxID=4521 RepID=A0AAD8RM92_LOLMU|nr:hypothetical protein QYE76_002004 [Lolium multiflorum]
MILMELPPVHRGLGEPNVSDLGLDYQGDSPWILDSGRVSFATPSDTLLGPIEPARDVSDDNVHGNCTGQNFLVAQVTHSIEGAECAGVATETILGVLLVLAMFLVLVIVVIFLDSSRLLDLL